MIPVILGWADVPSAIKMSSVSRTQRSALIGAVKDLPMVITSLRGYEEAVVTRGGVSVKEIDPKTMASKKLKGLFFAGEVLDLDASTGGFNLQIAWSTGYAAGKGAAGE